MKTKNEIWKKPRNSKSTIWKKFCQYSPDDETCTGCGRFCGRRVIPKKKK